MPWFISNNFLICDETNDAINIELTEDNQYICDKCYKRCSFNLRNGVMNHSYLVYDKEFEKLVKQLINEKQILYKNLPIVFNKIENDDYLIHLSLTTFYTNTCTDIQMESTTTLKEANDSIYSSTKNLLKSVIEFIDSMVNTAEAIVNNKVQYNLIEDVVDIDSNECNRCKSKSKLVEFVNESDENKFVDFKMCTKCGNVTAIKKIQKTLTNQLEEAVGGNKLVDDYVESDVEIESGTQEEALSKINNVENDTQI